VPTGALSGAVARPTRPGRRPRCSGGGGLILPGAQGRRQARRGGAGLTRVLERWRVAAQRRSSASDGAPVTGDIYGELLQLDEGVG
jgi:hypothetical protein